MLFLRVRNVCANFPLKKIIKILVVLIMIVLEQNNQRCMDIIDLWMLLTTNKIIIVL